MTVNGLHERLIPYLGAEEQPRTHFILANLGYPAAIDDEVDPKLANEIIEIAKLPGTKESWEGIYQSHLARKENSGWKQHSAKFVIGDRKVSQDLVKLYYGLEFTVDPKLKMMSYLTPVVPSDETEKLTITSFTVNYPFNIPDNLVVKPIISDWLSVQMSYFNIDGKDYMIFTIIQFEDPESYIQFPPDEKDIVYMKDKIEYCIKEGYTRVKVPQFINCEFYYVKNMSAMIELACMFYAKAYENKLASAA